MAYLLNSKSSVRHVHGVSAVASPMLLNAEGYIMTLHFPQDDNSSLLLYTLSLPRLKTEN